MTGRFITLEGGEGVGKSTQLDRLADALRSREVSLITTREPGGTIGAEAIRALLMTGADDKWSAQTEALLFAAARADHVGKVIAPALSRGDWVICDRFVDSTRAYQGGGGGISDEDIMTLHRIGSGGLLPDKTFLLDLPSDQGAARADQRSPGVRDRMAAKEDAYHEAVRTRFLELAAAEPGRFAVVDARQPTDAVTQAMLSSLVDLLP